MNEVNGKVADNANKSRVLKFKLDENHDDNDLCMYVSMARMSYSDKSSSRNFG